MKRFVFPLVVLLGAPAWAGQGASGTLTVSSGTFKAIQGFSNNSGNFVQGIAVADSSYTFTAPVDAVQGLTVTISSGVAEIGNVKNSGTFGVQAAQSGTWTVQPGNTANTTAWKVDGSAVTQPVSGTFWQATQPISGTVTAAQTTNSSLRASVDIDGSSNTVVLGAGAATIGALTANQSVNVAQINGVTPLMGNGATGTGSHRVTLSNDNTAIANWGQGATGAAAPTGAVFRGGIAKTSLPSAATDGNLTGALEDKFGRTVSILDCPRDLMGTSTMTITSSTAETVFISSGAAGVFNDLVSVIALNTSATATRLDFRSGTFGGTVSFALYIPAGETRGLTTSHIWPQATSASQWTVTSSASVADVRVYATYCQNK